MKASIWKRMKNTRNFSMLKKETKRVRINTKKKLIKK